MRPRDARARRLVVTLIVAFGLTVVCFLTSSVVADHRSRGIDEAARSVTTMAVPSIEHLTEARTALRRIEVYSHDLGDGDASAAPRLQQAQKTFADEYELYRAVAPYPGEPELWARIATATSEMNASVERVLADARTGSGAADEVTTQTRPNIERLDVELEEATQLNARTAADLSDRITAIKGAARSWSLVLDTMSLVFAGIATMLVVRIARRLTTSMEDRATELEHFAGRVAHDIRSPLQSVSTALELTRQRPELDAKTQSMLDRGLQTLRRIAQLVDALLVFAVSGRSPHEPDSADVMEIISDVAEEMRPAAEAKEIELNVEVSPSRLVACSPGVLVSLVSNLVGNAIKYLGSAVIRRIDICVRRVGRMVRVEVRDTGPGVPPALRERIFDPDLRARESTIPGIGLGLATVRRLAEAHGGSTGVEKNPEGGSVFWFQIPEAVARDVRAGLRPERAPSLTLHHQGETSD